MERLLTLQYYFTTRPDPNFQYTTYTIAFIFILFALAAGIKIYLKKYNKDKSLNKVIRTHPTTLFNFGAALLFLLLSREAGIPIFSMRIWWFILFISLVIWAVKSVISFNKKYSSYSTKKENNKKINQYLPKRKKGKKKKRSA